MSEQAQNCGFLLQPLGYLAWRIDARDLNEARERRVWHIANEMLVALKVRYTVVSSAATQLGEGPQAQPYRCRTNQRRSAIHPIEPIPTGITSGR